MPKSMTQRVLSKSKLMAFRQCPKRLWLELNEPSQADVSESSQTRFQAGHEVGTLSHQLYDPTHQGQIFDLKDTPLSAVMAATQEALPKRRSIFEAGFEGGGARAFADVLLPVGRTQWRIVEVKSSTKVKPEHEDDVAVQWYAAHQAKLPLKSIALACIDNKFVYQGKGNYEGLLKEHDLTQQALDKQPHVKQWIESASKVARQKSAPLISTGGHCKQPYECAFISYCKSQEPGHEPSGKKRFDREAALMELLGIGLPALFLDFETINPAIPKWKGTKPYQHIPFQFSLHGLNLKMQLYHAEFLDTTGLDPRKAIALDLLKYCEQPAWLEAPIFAYNASFERGCIKQLGTLFPKLSKRLQNISDRLVDLWPITKQHYEHPRMEGSYSLKAVLPTIPKASNYDQLDSVRDGLQAQQAYLELAFPSSNTAPKSTSSRAQTTADLLAYCRLDTYAMIELWAFLAQCQDSLLPDSQARAFD